MVKIETINGKKFEMIFRDDQVVVDGKEYSYGEVLKAIINNDDNKASEDD